MSDETKLSEFHWAIGRYLSEVGWVIEDVEADAFIVSDPRSSAFDDGPIKVRLVVEDII